ncbi:MAG: AAA family ATPase, partial [Bacteroidota bacterium]
MAQPNGLDVDTASDPRRMRGSRLSSDVLRRSCDPESLSFQTTDDLNAIVETVGQPRAEEALRFGMGMAHRGYNFFALGPGGVGRHALVRSTMEEAARTRPVPPDLSYVNNFEDERRPRALLLPAGQGRQLRDDMDRFIEELRTALPAAFESEEYQEQHRTLEERIQQDQQKALEDLQKRARQEGVEVVQTPMGLTLTPSEEGREESPGEMDDETRRSLEEAAERFQTELQQILQKVPQRQRMLRERVRQLNQDVARRAIDESFDELRQRYDAHQNVLDHLGQVREDVVEKVEALVSAQLQQTAGPQEEGGGALMAPHQQAAVDALYRRYKVNLLVDRSESDGAPLIFENHPTYPKLIGEIEHIAEMGMLTTDFTLIKPGAVHRANGGYLVLDAHQVLLQPLAWEALKRTLMAGEIRIESPGESLGLVSTVTLEPEPIQLDVKVALIGDP